MTRSLHVAQTFKQAFIFILRLFTHTRPGGQTRALGDPSDRGQTPTSPSGPVDSLMRHCSTFRGKRCYEFDIRRCSWTQTGQSQVSLKRKLSHFQHSHNNCHRHILSFTFTFLRFYLIELLHPEPVTLNPEGARGRAVDQAPWILSRFYY